MEPKPALERIRVCVCSSMEHELGLLNHIDQIDNDDALKKVTNYRVIIE